MPLLEQHNYNLEKKKKNKQLKHICNFAKMPIFYCCRTPSAEIILPRPVVGTAFEMPPAAGPMNSMID